MSERSPLITPHEVRVCIVEPDRGLVISPDHEKVRLFSGAAEPGETTESAAHRIVHEEKHMGLPRMKTRLQIGRIGMAVGYALQPSNPEELNLRLFTVRAFNQDELLEHIERNPDYTDPVDQEFIYRAITRQPRH